MNREHAKAIAPIIKAFGDGEDVQVDHATRGWSTFDDLSFTGSPKLYRIKPKPREFLICNEDDWKSGDLVHVLKGSNPILPGTGSWIKVIEVL